MAILLNQRGRLVLHASAVNLRGNGIAFLGASGDGKSSVAASLLMRGHSFVVDDIAAIELQHGKAVLYPGFPQLRLATEAAQSMRAGISELQYMNDLDEKRNYRVLSNFQQDPIEINKIFILAEGRQIEFQPITPQQAVIELARYSMPTSIVKLDRVANFNKCVKLAGLIESYQLIRPLSLKMLPIVAEKIEEHVKLIYI
jgi:hypothetical protein